MTSETVTWEQVLDRLEADLTAVEELADTGLGHELAGWEPPELDEPLPAELLTRARELHERQQRLHERLPELITRTGRQAELARKVGARTGGLASRSAIYVDTSA